MRFQTGYYFKKGMVVQQDFEKGSQEIRSLQKLAIFFRVSRWGRRGGGLVRGTLRYINRINMVHSVPCNTVLVDKKHQSRNLPIT